jgi:hypothetical protein
VLFYRANLVDDIKEARHFIQFKQFSYLIPKYKKTDSFVSHKVIIRPYTQIPLFAFLKLNPLLAFKRKIKLYHALRSRNKLITLAPKWLYVNYNLMIVLLIDNPIKVRYSFVDSKTLEAFLGAARYF